MNIDVMPILSVQVSALSLYCSGTIMTVFLQIVRRARFVDSLGTHGGSRATHQIFQLCFTRC